MTLASVKLTKDSSGQGITGRLSRDTVGLLCTLAASREELNTIYGLSETECKADALGKSQELLQNSYLLSI